MSRHDVSLVEAYGDELVRLATECPNLVVLDADLSADCGLRPFEAAHPERFFEFGIAEQDMVSSAGGMALLGLCPVVNSFAAFLVSRANEQIYNNATEGTKVVYGCHYAGLLPAAAGFSHQSVRDISLVAALPGFEVVQPADPRETASLLRWCVLEGSGSSALRIRAGRARAAVVLPADYRPVPGRGVRVLDLGSDVALVTYGATMLEQAVGAAELLARWGQGGTVISTPWLSSFDVEWWIDELSRCRRTLVVEDHSVCGGLGDALLRAGREAGVADLVARVDVAGIVGLPACGQDGEVLHAHRLDAASLARRAAAGADSRAHGTVPVVEVTDA